MDGSGLLKYKDGTFYKGEFVMNKPHGLGVNYRYRIDIHWI